MKKIYLAIWLLFFMGFHYIFAQVSMNTTGSYTQNFNSLLTTSSGTWTDNSTIANWYSQRSAGGNSITANAGTSNTGDLYSYGTGTLSDRALGSLGSAATGNFAHGLLLQNTSGSTITSINVSYKLEQWRNSAAAVQTVSFYYKTSSTIISTLNPNINTTWIAVTALDGSSPITGGTAGSLDGNLAVNQVGFSNISIPSLSLANSDYIMLKWDDPDHAGSDHGLAIDDVLISWTVPPATNSIALTSSPQDKGPFCNATASGISLNYTYMGTVTAPFLELSNSSGSFASGTTNLGGVVSGTGPYTITGNIPAGQAPGTSYRVRIRSTDATPVLSSDNGSNIIVYGQPAALPANGGGTASVCIGSTTPAFTNSTPGGTWTSSNMAVATVDAGGVVTGLSAGGTSIIYIVSNGTCSAQSNSPVTVSAPPADPAGAITGTNPACSSTMLGFPASAVSNVVYYWQSSPSGTSMATASNGSANYPVSTSGTYYVRAYNTVSTCWSSGTVSLPVVINTPIVIGTQPSNQSVGAGSSASFSVSVSFGTVSGYQWQVNDGSGFVNVSTGSGGNTASYTTPATTPGMSGYNYRCIVKGSAPCSDVISASATLTVTYVSTATDYFRSNVVSGSWSAAASWQSSPDNTNWYPATLAPSAAANTINILTGQTIVVSSTVSLDQLTINGTLVMQTGAVLNINDGAGDDIVIAANGLLKIVSTTNYASSVIPSASACIHIATGGKIIIGDGTGTVGSNYETFATSVINIWDTGAVFEYNSNSIFSSSGLSFFPNAAANVIPVFKVTKTGASPSAGSPFLVNGRMQVNSNFSFGGGGIKTFRNGITGNGTLTQSPTAGGFAIGGTNAVLGGASLNIVLSSQLNLNSSVSVPADSIVTLSGSSIDNNLAGNTLTVNGILDVTTSQFVNTSGIIVINGKYRTANTGGFTGGGSSIPSGTVTINAGSTIEYYAAGAQAVQGSTVNYANLTLSGSGTKLLQSTTSPNGLVYITGSAVLDVSGFTFGNAATSIKMDGGRLRMSGVGSKPDIDGSYTLTGGVIEFASSQATKQTVKGKNAASSDILYQNIEVTGNNVGIGNANITMKDNSFFTIKTGGSFEVNSDAIIGPGSNETVLMETGAFFKCGSSLGFIGATAGANSPSIRNDIANVVLQPNSTVDYYRSNPPLSTGDQVITATVPYQHLILSGTGIKTAPAGTLTVQGNLTKTGTSSFAHNNGKVLLNGTAQSFSGLPYCQLELSGGIKTTSGGSISCSVDSVLSINSGANLTISAGDSVTIKSTAVRTASVAALTGPTPITYAGTGAGMGKFVIERYLLSGRKWRLLSVPTTRAGQSIRNSWQENGLYVPNYGFKAADVRSDWAARGYDQLGFNTSVKVFGAPDSWYALDYTNTSNMNSREGYMVFVAGDRNITSTGSSATTFRTSGSIKTGGSIANITADQYTVVANPYPSRIDLRNLAFSGSVTRAVAVWDPSLTGSYGLGAWNYIYEDAGVWKVFSNSSIYGPKDGAVNFIESGMAFMVRAFGSAGTVGFSETAKVVGSHVSTFTSGAAQQLRIDLNYLAPGGEPVALDGAFTDFDQKYDIGIDIHDIHKMNNWGEQIAFKTGDSLLAIQRRGSLVDQDTLFLQMARLKTQAYQFEIRGENLDYPGRTGFLVDQYLNTMKPFALDGSSLVNFTVENVPGSYAPDRFYMVFRQAAAGPLPVNFTSIKAVRNTDQTIAVMWKVGNEAGITDYEIQRSSDGIQFRGIGVARPAGNSGRADYLHLDAQPLPADNFYRIRASSISGLEQYSSIVKVSAVNGRSAISLFPNPVKDGQLHLQFTGQRAGNYQLNLFNSAGQVMYSGLVTVTGAVQSESLALPAGLPAGSYQLRVTGTGKQLVIPVQVVD